MMRSVFQFFSMLAFGVLSLGLVATVLPWLANRSPWGGGTAFPVLHFESALAGLAVGLTIGVLARYHWADIPRRMVTWVLVRERQFFYYALIASCIGVLVFY